MKRYALLSVSDKTMLASFARQLSDLGFEIISSGGTARHLTDSGIEVQAVSEVTACPEMLDGRVKTLHPAIHAGILARRDHEDDLKSLADNGFHSIDLVCVNLYPFAKVLASGAEEAELIENIDIGGPTLLRSAAKNFRDVFVVTDPQDYSEVIECLKTIQKADNPEAYYSEEALKLRKSLAYKVFRKTSAYDTLIASYFEKVTAFTDDDPSLEDLEPDTLFPAQLDIEGTQVTTLRYGENPHQRAALYRLHTVSDSSLLAAEQLHGKEMSYNNIQDTNAALELLYEFDQACVVAVKHMNPCGMALADTIDEAWERAYAADPVSIFGGIVVANRPISAAMARQMHEIFLEIIVAPDYEPEAFKILSQKKNIRLLKLAMKSRKPLETRRMVSVMDGFLVQENDNKQVSRQDCRLMTEKAPAENEWDDLINGFKVVKHCKSNAIVVFKDGQTLGCGVGQSNRVGAAKLALEQAGERAKGAILASDAFFPMSDSLELAAQFGISSVIQPGGSIRDQESVDLCNSEGMSMVATGIRHFKH